MTDYVKPIVPTLLGAVTFVDAVDITLRLIAGIASVIAAYWAVRSYRARVRLDEEKLKQLRKDES